MNIADKLKIGLSVLGWAEDPTDRSRYTAYVNPRPSKAKVFVGKNGALRCGLCASKSYAVNPIFHAKVMEAYEKSIAQLQAQQAEREAYGTS